MKNKGSFVSLALFAVTALSAPAAESKLVEGKISGTLSDSMCQADHSAMIKMGGYGSNAVACTQKCLQEGNKLVFIDRKTKTVYSLQNAGAAKKYAGKNVVISGHIDSEAKIIHVHSIKLG